MKKNNKNNHTNSHTNNHTHLNKWDIFCSIFTPIPIVIKNIHIERHRYLRKRIFRKGYTILDKVCLNDDLCMFIFEKNTTTLNNIYKQL